MEVVIVLQVNKLQRRNTLVRPGLWILTIFWLLASLSFEAARLTYSHSWSAQSSLGIRADSCYAVCGDGNGDDAINEQDLAVLFDYLFNSALLLGSCLENLDLDDYQTVNIRDAAWLCRSLSRQAGGDIEIACPPTQPAYQPAFKPADTLEIQQAIILQAGSSSLSIPFIYKNSDSLAALALPLRVRIGGSVPQIDSVMFSTRALSSDYSAATVDPDSATVNLGLLWKQGLAPGKDTLFTLFLSIAPAPDARVVRVDTAQLSPDNHIFFVERQDSDGIIPFLIGFGPIPLYVQAFSPVNLIVIDPNNDSIGYSFNTIGKAHYDTSNDSIHIEEALPGNYIIKVVKDTLDVSNDSSYAIEARIDGTADNLLASSAPVPQEGESHNYAITSQPSLPACLSLSGDANADGHLTLVDIISIVNYIFNHPGCLPAPDCWLWGLNCRADWNGDGLIKLSDVIQEVNFIFNRPNGPWAPVPVGACCLPVEQN